MSKKLKKKISEFCQQNARMRDAKKLKTIPLPLETLH